MKLYLDAVVSNLAAVLHACQTPKMENMESVLVEVEALHLESDAARGFCGWKQAVCSEKCGSATSVQGAQCLRLMINMYLLPVICQRGDAITGFLVVPAKSQKADRRCSR